MRTRAIFSAAIASLLMLGITACNHIRSGNETSAISQQTRWADEIALGKPTRLPPHTKAAQALRVAKSFSAGTFAPGRPVSVEYGSLDPHMSVPTGRHRGYQPLGLTDVWVVHVSGFTRFPPGGGQMPGARQPPLDHQAFIVVDDEAGKFLFEEDSP